MDSHCPNKAQSAPRSSAIRFARHAASNKKESLLRFPSDGDDIGDTAAGGSFPTFPPPSWTLAERRAAGRDEIKIVGSNQINGTAGAGRGTRGDAGCAGSRQEGAVGFVSYWLVSCGERQDG